MDSEISRLCGLTKKASAKSDFVRMHWIRSTSSRICLRPESRRGGLYSVHMHSTANGVLRRLV